MTHSLIGGHSRVVYSTSDLKNSMITALFP